MKFAIVVALAWASVCVGQQGGQGHVDVIPCSNCTITLSPKPLKCGKYEHSVTEKLPDVHDGGINITNSTHTYCAPDMHEVTEQEWQQLMTFLNGQLKENCRLAAEIKHKDYSYCYAKDAFGRKPR